MKKRKKNKASEVVILLAMVSFSIVMEFEMGMKWVCSGMNM